MLVKTKGASVQLQRGEAHNRRHTGKRIPLWDDLRSSRAPAALHLGIKVPWRGFSRARFQASLLMLEYSQPFPAPSIRALALPGFQVRRCWAVSSVTATADQR